MYSTLTSLFVFRVCNFVMYVQLDEACCRTKKASIGGPMILLSIWSWLRLPVGRPILLQHKDWNHHGNDLRRPTWAYMWDNMEPFRGESQESYMRYTAELVALTPEKVHKTNIFYFF